MQPAWFKSIRAFSVIVVVLGIGLAGIAVWWMGSKSHSKDSTLHSAEVGSRSAEASDPVPEVDLIEFPKESWTSASIEVKPVWKGDFAQHIELTGKIALNEEHVAHIFPLVEGRVEQVKIQYGDRVKRGDLLLLVQSQSVGERMLSLFQNRLQRDFSITKDQWTQVVSTNTQAMIKLIREGAEIEEIEKQLLNRPMGEYRDKLMTAYISHYKAKKHVERLAPLSQGGAVTGKQFLEAEAELNATRATLQSLVEQLSQDTLQSSAISKQSVKELQTRVSVDETNLKILGFKEADLAEIDPARQGESIAHYPIHSPFDGTIISKDVVLLERVGPDKQILSIADLSTVWVTADIYEEHLSLLHQLENRPILLKSNAWPGKTFKAKIFYTGDIVHESSRTISVRALADNAEGFLKPGMFVEVQLPGLNQPDVLQIPTTAILEHEGKSFVFVYEQGDQFRRRDVTIGRRNDESTEIRMGLKPDEMVVTNGGFALKSRMLASLLSE